MTWGRSRNPTLRLATDGRHRSARADGGPPAVKEMLGHDPLAQDATGFAGARESCA